MQSIDVCIEFKYLRSIELQMNMNEQTIRQCNRPYPNIATNIPCQTGKTFGFIHQINAIDGFDQNLGQRSLQDVCTTNTKVARDQLGSAQFDIYENKQEKIKQMQERRLKIIQDLRSQGYCV